MPKPTIVFLILCLAFFIYSFCIYCMPLKEREEKRFNRSVAAKGRLVWQTANCQSCHQLYGLGGYLGPDLTNIMSDPGKSRDVLKIIIRAGVKQMPAYQLSETDMEYLLEFLRSVDVTGCSDPRKFNVTPTGMIHENEAR